MKDKIVYIQSDSLNVYFHLALEYYLTTEKTFENETVLLFWRTDPTIVVGRYQNTLEEVNLAYAEEKKINVVRRLSGGGTVYYDQGGWQYSFITKTGKREISFREYMEPVVEALGDLGVKAEFSGRNDILVKGRKVSGTAQYIHNGYTVHHGTLLYAVNLDEIVRSTTADREKIISKGIKSVRSRVTNIADHMTEPVGALKFRDVMVRKLRGGNSTEYKLSEQDIKRINEIAIERFDNDKCKFGKNPPCTISRSSRYAGGSIKANINIKDNMIEAIFISGDFFGNIDKEMLEEALIGCNFTRNDVALKLKELNIENKIYMISIENILSMLFDSE